jgi:hypothetical protein
VQEAAIMQAGYRAKSVTPLVLLESIDKQLRQILGWMNTFPLDQVRTDHSPAHVMILQ